MFINSLKTHVLEKMFPSLCFPIKKSDVSKIIKLSKKCDCSLWPVTWDVPLYIVTNNFHLILHNTLSHVFVCTSVFQWSPLTFCSFLKRLIYALKSSIFVRACALKFSSCSSMRIKNFEHETTVESKIFAVSVFSWIKPLINDALFLLIKNDWKSSTRTFKQLHCSLSIQKPLLRDKKKLYHSQWHIRLSQPFVDSYTPLMQDVLLVKNPIPSNPWHILINLIGFISVLKLIQDFIFCLRGFQHWNLKIVT